MRKIMSLLAVLVLTAYSAENSIILTAEYLVGKWEFMHWAESTTAEKKHKVGYIMDFRSNGEVITKMPKGDVTEHYKVNKNTIIYKGKHGKQIWKLLSFTQDKSFVVNHMGTVMTFEKR